MKNRVVITGMGIVSPVGVGLEDYWAGLISGRNGIARITHFDPTDYRSQMAAEVKDFDPRDWIDAKSVNRMDRFIHFGLASSIMAFNDAGLELGKFDANRAGVIIGSGIGGSETIESGYNTLNEKGPKAINPFFVTKVIINMAASMASVNLGLKGPISAPSLACSTGASAIGDAFRILERGDADIMFAGGSEACITRLPYAGFCAARSMSTRNDSPETASRPFDKDRDGFVMGEGAGIIVLESLEHARRRGARIYAELVGYGNTADAFHYTAPPPDGDGMVRVMQVALKDAGVEPHEVDYINAHGTSTVLNDKIENAAISKVFGEHAQKLKISSIKSMIGHLLAAAGAVEMVATVLSIHFGKVTPTINFQERDPECPLDYVTDGSEDLDVNVAISNSFGFGGCNA
ncbi:MAG TPA: beta-ketoacyl-ACP synthase II, partial [Acidobacteriota bacterium]|nr:beta-ketoacyl-ACP synthase II [Acidobacteriota bacterium]